MLQPTEKQLDYLQALKEDKIRKNKNCLSTFDDLLSLALTVNLPTPTTKEETLAQIEALKEGYLKTYAKANQSWAEKVVSHVTTACGRSSGKKKEMLEAFLAANPGSVNYAEVLKIQ